MSLCNICTHNISTIHTTQYLYMLSPHAVMRDFFASLCFHLLDLAPVPARAPPPGKHFTGVGFPLASPAPKFVVRTRSLEPFM
jgi:hypothetical protein